MVAQAVFDFKYERTKKAITPHSGLSFFVRYICGLGLTGLTNTYLAMPGSTRGYTPAEYVIVFCMLLCGGGSTLEDIRVIKQDLGLRVVCGLNRFMSTDARGDWLRRTGEYGLPG